jgi:hypothetical protein
MEGQGGRWGDVVADFAKNFGVAQFSRKTGTLDKFRYILLNHAGTITH